MKQQKNSFHKKKLNHFWAILFVCFGFFNCKQQDSSNLLKISLDTKKSFQTIEGFGASDAWRVQYVGKNWPIEKKEKIAELLFSKELDDKGSPKGIGLSLWRFYIGAGTFEQGDSSNIKNNWRRAESFINVDGTYDWTKQQGQQWFLNKAKEYGVEHFLAFSIAPPVQWSLNGKGYNDDVISGNINLQKDKFDDYARFMVNVLNHFNEQGISFDYLAPINEPQWNWETKTQEGTPATNEDIIKLSKEIDTNIKQNNLATKIVLSEAADLRWLFSNYGKPERGNQMDYLFGEKHRINTLKNTISGHSYFTTWPVDSLISIRQKLSKKLKKFPNLNYWQSEFCILENSDDIGGGRPRDLQMPTALYVARVMHADLTIANASSWQWWTALTNADYKDGLIYLDTGDPNDMYNLKKLENDGDFHDSKLLWAFGNFSRFVKPGMTRIEVNTNQKKSLKDEYQDVLLSAYLDKNNNQIAIVAINYSDELKTIHINDFSIKNMFITSFDKNLESVNISDGKIILEPKSVNTINGKLQ